MNNNMNLMFFYRNKNVYFIDISNEQNAVDIIINNNERVTRIKYRSD